MTQRADGAVIGAYMTRQAQALSRLFEAEKINGDIDSLIQAPLTLVYTIRLRNAGAAHVSKLTGDAFRRAVEVALETAPVMVKLAGGLLEIETPSMWPTALPAPEMHGSGWRAPVGVTGRRTAEGKFELATVDLSDPITPSLLVVGTPGSGKTQAVQTLIYQLARQNKRKPLKFVVLCHPTKVKSWEPVDRLPQTVAVVSDPVEIERVLTHFATLSETRTFPVPPWVIIVDDLMALLQKSKGLAAPLTVLASLGREPRVHLILISQRVGTVGTGGQAVSGAIQTRLIFSAADAQDAASFAGQGGSQVRQLSGRPGDGVLITNGVEQRVIASQVWPEEWSKLYAELGGAQPGTAVGQRAWNRVGHTSYSVPLTGREGGKVDAGGLSLPPTLSPGTDTRVADEEAKARVRAKAQTLGLGALPLRGERSKESETALLRYAFFELRENENATMDLCFGGRNGRYRAKVKAAAA